MNVKEKPRTCVQQNRLDPRFVKRGSGPVKARRSKKTEWHAKLPFVHGKGAHGSWNVPAKGGYFGGYATGEAMALMLLKEFRNGEGGDLSGNALSWIVGSAMARFAQVDGPAQQAVFPYGDRSEGYASFRGQYIGFCNTLGAWLVAASKRLGQNLDSVSEDQLLANLNAGAMFDEAEYLASVAN